jgi:hypothetical protein
MATLGALTAAPTVDEVQRLADRYRATLADADTSLGNGSLDHRLVVALVVESATAVRLWLETRVRGGAALAQPLRDFLTPAATMDRLGRAVKAVETQAVNKSVQLASALVVKGTLPVWAGTVVAAIGGFYFRVHEAGFTAGTGFTLLVATGGAWRLWVPLMRFFQMGGPQQLESAAVSTVSAAQSIGRPAEALFDKAMKSDLAAIYPAAKPAAASPLLRKIRGSATTIVVAAWVAFAVAVLFFVSGFAAGVSAPRTPLPTIPSFDPGF